MPPRTAARRALRGAARAVVLLALGWLAAQAPAAARAEVPAGLQPMGLQPLVGEERKALIREDDTLLDIAFRERLGFAALARSNPDVDVWIPEPGTVVQLPTRMILPDVAREGLVVNVPEMRLYDFTAASGPEVLSVAVGDAVDPTLLGSFRIGSKRRDPAWYVPESIRREKPELPPVVPPGPDNPLGRHWMTIGATTYGIHGTNNRWSIGREATHGCVRLYDDEMAKLFERAPSGTPVHLVYQPFKWGREGDTLFLEVHPDLYGRIDDPREAALATPRALELLAGVDLEAVDRALEAVRGVPVAVGTVPPGDDTPAPGVAESQETKGGGPPRP